MSILKTERDTGKYSIEAANNEHIIDGWDGRIRTYEWRYQKPLPYHLATSQKLPQIHHSLIDYKQLINLMQAFLYELAGQIDNNNISQFILILLGNKVRKFFTSICLHIYLNYFTIAIES